MCMYTCTCMSCIYCMCVSCIYCMSWIHRYRYAAGSGCKSAIAAMPWWSAVLAGSPKLPPPPPAQPCSPATRSSPQRPTLLKPKFALLAGRKSWLRNEGSWPVPPRGTTTGMGRERELRKCDGSYKRSRKYSRKPRERTPLTFRNVSLGKWSKNWPCYRRYCTPLVCILDVVGGLAVWVITTPKKNSRKIGTKLFSR